MDRGGIKFSWCHGHGLEQSLPREGRYLSAPKVSADQVASEDLTCHLKLLIVFSLEILLKLPKSIKVHSN
jgi:hypothetical protein